MTLSNEELAAFADGETDDEETRRIAALAAQSPELQDAILRHRLVRGEIAAAFSPILAEEVPDRLQALLRSPPSRPSIRSRMAQFVRPRIALRSPAWPIGAALAMGVLAGLLMLPWNPFRGSAVNQNAQGALAQALDRQLASAQSTAAPIRIGLSFRAKDGRNCRTYVDSPALAAGVACRSSGGWTIVASAPAEPAEGTGPYGMAGTGMPDKIRATVAQLAAGEPFDATAERRARDAGWR